MGIGAQVAVETGLGADAIAMTWIALSNVFGWSLGTANNVFSFIFLLVVLLVDWRFIGIGTIISPLVQSSVIDLLPTGYMTSLPLWIKLVVMALGIIVLSVGCGMYAAANLGCGTFIGAVMALNARFHWRISLVMILLEVGLFVIAALAGAPITIGPIASAVASGPITDITVSYTNKWLAKTVKPV